PVRFFRSSRTGLSLAFSLPLKNELLLQIGFGNHLFTHQVQAFHLVAQTREALVLGLAVIVAIEDLLADARQAEEAEAEIEIEVVDRDAEVLTETRHQLLARWRAGRQAWHGGELAAVLRIIGLGPIT